MPLENVNSFSDPTLKSPEEFLNLVEHPFPAGFDWKSTPGKRKAAALEAEREKRKQKKRKKKKKKKKKAKRNLEGDLEAGEALNDPGEDSGPEVTDKQLSIKDIYALNISMKRKVDLLLQYNHITEGDGRLLCTECPTFSIPK